METISFLLRVYLLALVYVIIVAVINQYVRKQIEQNKEGKFGGALEDDLQKQDKRTRDLLLGFEPAKAIELLSHTIVAFTAIAALIISMQKL